MRIIIAFVIFSVIILFHEWGHFLLAKLSGIVVTEFSLGMGPRLFSIERGGTRYSLKLLPLGGSCAMLGEDTDEMAEGSFNSASVGKRIAVVAAGPVFNFILAFILSIIIVHYAGFDEPFVSFVAEGSNAEEAGLMQGDRIVSYDGYHIDVGRDLYIYLYLHTIEENEPIRLEVLRDGEKKYLSFLPDIQERYLLGFNRSDANSMTVESLIPGLPLEKAGLQPGDTIVGVGGVPIEDGAAYEEYLKDHPLKEEPVQITYERNGLEYEVEIVPMVYRTPTGGFSYNLSFQEAKGLQALPHALTEVKYMIRSTVLSLKGLFTGGVGVKDLSGPVGVVDAIGDTYEQSKSGGMLVVVINLLNMAVLLSANLGVMNLLPIPALDGGRLLLLLVEAVRRKPLNRNLEGSIHLTGFILLMVLMAFVMFQDIMKLF